MAHVLIIAGLPPIAFKKIQTVSATLLAPGGFVVRAPLHGRYYAGYAKGLIAQAHQYAMTLREDEHLSVQLLYVDYKDSETIAFLEWFFPFCLPVAVALPTFNGGHSKADREALNRLADDVTEKSRILRQRAHLISERTHVANLTPLLLPVRNFDSKDLKEMLLALFQSAGSTPSLNDLLNSVVTEFLARNPRTKPPAVGYATTQHCFSDGHLYFKSPGRHRHGYFRRDSVGHDLTCLLNARSRIGGTYQHNFHFDCEPVRGTVKSAYDNCHSVPTAPNEGYVNIAPNDFIR